MNLGFFFYQFLTSIFGFFSTLFLKYRVFAGKEDKYRYIEKLGIPTIEPSINVIWFHVASLGEIKSLYSILKHYQKNEKIKILITSVTLSSYEYFKKNLKNKNTFHQFAPLDVPSHISKFLKKWKPSVAIFIESEIWPNMIFQTSKNCKLILLNCRISKKTFKKWQYFRNSFKKIMQKFDYILPQNNEVMKFLNYFELKNIKLIGNIKFTNIKKNNPNILEIICSKRCWAAMSIHFDEVDDIISVHSKTKEKYPHLTTFLIPRHLDKINIIIAKIKSKNINYKVISKSNKVENFNGIVVVDRYGVAEDIFNKVKIVFMGGSLINHGGQNPIEPLKYGCKILTGKNIGNFNEIYNDLIIRKLANIINTSDNLADELNFFFKRDQLINNFKGNEVYYEFSQNIFSKTIKFLDNYIIK